MNGLLEVAVITRPTEQRRWWAVRGRGAWSSPTDTPPAEGSPLTVSTVDTLATARIDGFVDPASHVAASIAERARWTVDPLGPIIGLVEGRIDAVIAPGGELWDHAPQVEQVLTSEFGEPEDYARALMPGATPRHRASLILTGLVIGLVVALLLRLSRDLGWEPFASWGPLAPALGLVFLAAGVLAEFWRYQRRGHD